MTRELGMEKSESDCGDGSKEEEGSVAGCSGFFGREEEIPKPGKWALREDWLATHPTFTKMMSLEVADSTGVYAAFLVYLDLLEVRNWQEVSFTGLAEFQLVCLHGREKETEPLQVVVPAPAQVSFSHERPVGLQSQNPTVTCSTHLEDPRRLKVFFNAYITLKAAIVKTNTRTQGQHNLPK
ncbi:tRNA-splicing endonuclease subunit Sen15 isoform X2 [Crotalus tigris]|uniref:tRNA-splicing endonuclease subunit Sen15 isoform X2 n=1 Tax=Crotalus tigris TaxID=88082 RepID=UPI00192F1553|nr:tRNA-splicing endonuclease subunit Sen15 isoform X2 [Crotalus tigris]